MKGLKWKEKKKGLNDWINNKSKLKGLICNLAKDEEKKKGKIYTLEGDSSQWI